MSRIGKSTDTESKLVGGAGVREREMGNDCYWERISFGGDDMFWN